MAVELGWPMAEQRFRAMGTDCHIVVVGTDGKRRLDQATARVEQLESLWSRFLPDSEISKLNDNGGVPMAVSDETFALIERAVAAHELTGGAFDPTMELRLAELGYDRAFERLAIDVASDAGPAGCAAVRISASSRCDGIVIDHTKRTVALPVEIGFDPGGIGKGYAADIVAVEAMDAGAWGVMINLGGDLRVIGTPPRGDTWIVEIAEPAVDPKTLATVRLTNAGLATSTTRKRRWPGPAGELHHLLDPNTGLPVRDGPQLVSVIGGEAWWAEAAATALAASPDSDPCERPPNCCGMQVMADGTHRLIGDFDRYLLSPTAPRSEQ